MASRLDTDEMRPTPPQTEDSQERGFVDEQPQDLGQSEHDPDDAGDIADEGTGRRG